MVVLTFVVVVLSTLVMFVLVVVLALVVVTFMVLSTLVMFVPVAVLALVVLTFVVVTLVGRCRIHGGEGNRVDHAGARDRPLRTLGFRGSGFIGDGVAAVFAQRIVLGLVVEVGASRGGQHEGYPGRAGVVLGCCRVRVVRGLGPRRIGVTIGKGRTSIDPGGVVGVLLRLALAEIGEDLDAGGLCVAVRVRGFGVRDGWGRSGGGGGGSAEQDLIEGLSRARGRLGIAFGEAELRLAVDAGSGIRWPAVGSRLSALGIRIRPIDVGVPGVRVTRIRVIRVRVTRTRVSLIRGSGLGHQRRSTRGCHSGGDGIRDAGRRCGGRSGDRRRTGNRVDCGLGLPRRNR